MLTLSRYLLHTELTVLLRRSHEWLYPLGFFLMIVSLFPLAFSPDPVFLQKYAAGCIWIAALLASLLSAEFIFTADLEDGYLEQCQLSAVPFAWHITIKLCAQWLTSELPLILLTPILGWLFHLSPMVIGALCMSLLCGTPILTCIGSFGVALTIGLRQQGALLGLLILPLLVPVLVFGVSITQQAQVGLSVKGPVAFLAALTLITIALLPWTIATTIRIGLDD